MEEKNLFSEMLLILKIKYYKNRVFNLWCRKKICYLWIYSEFNKITLSRDDFVKATF